MRRQGTGRIINIGSVCGFLPMPYMALYVATTHAVEGYSESLDANLLQPDSTLDEYRDVRATLGKRMTELIEVVDKPAVVAETGLMVTP